MLRAFKDASPAAIVIDNPDGVVTMWSTAAESLFGWTAAELLGRPNPTVPDDRQEEHRHLRARVLVGESLGKLEIERRHKNGSIRQVSLSLALLRDAAGEPRGVMEILEDVTERHELERQLRQAQKMDALGRMAGGIAHDFNNIMTAIRGYAALIASSVEKLASVDQRPPASEADQMSSRTVIAAGEIVRAAERASALTHELLAFSRSQVLQPTTLDAAEVVSSMEGMLRPLIGERTELVVSAPRGVGFVKADRVQLEQVILNLALNGRDAMPDGGTLIFESSVVLLDESYGRERIHVVPGHYVQFSVSDNGIGIDEKTQARIFEPFFTTKPDGQGTGLGLATVYGIVKQSGGYIFVYSEPGHGTTFKVYLPKVDGDVEHEDSTPRVDRLSLVGSETVLVVEDEELVRTLVREVLVGYGYAVLEAQNGEAALRIADRHRGPIELMLTDVIMPGMSALDLVDQMELTHPKTKTVCMSGYTNLATEQYGLRLARIPFIAKPFAPDRLAFLVRQVLDDPMPPRRNVPRQATLGGPNP